MPEIMEMIAARGPQNPSPDYLTDEVSTAILEVLMVNDQMTVSEIKSESPKLAQYSIGEMASFMTKLFNNDDVIMIPEKRRTYWKFKEK